MIVIGLTGSIAMGKSTAANMLREMSGVAVHCSDEAVRELYNDPAVIDLIKNAFPSTYDKKAGKIDKAKLIAELGRDHEKWDELESILHPFVQKAQQKFIQEQAQQGTKIVVLDIPLLFETGGENRVDYTICVSAPSFIQQQRLDKRIADGLMSEEDSGFRLARQMPDAEKQKRADFIVPTGQGIAPTRKALEKVIRDIKEKHLGNGNERGRLPSHDL